MGWPSNLAIDDAAGETFEAYTGVTVVVTVIVIVSATIERKRILRDMIDPPGAVVGDYASRLSDHVMSEMSAAFSGDDWFPPNS
jgi:hypothetical protein